MVEALDRGQCVGVFKLPGAVWMACGNMTLQACLLYILQFL